MRVDKFHREPVERQQLEFNVERRATRSGDLAGVPVEGGSLVRDVLISTEKPVRSGGGICKAAGAQLLPYLRNPVVMWAHNYREPPVAKATQLSVEPGIGISARFEFPQPGIYPLADTVRGLWDGGFINAASIGFMPLEWEMVDDPEIGSGKLEVGKGQQAEKIPVFNKWELYEFSLVAVPRDREALRRAIDELEGEGLEVGRWKLDGPTSNVQRPARQLLADTPAAAAADLPALDLQRFLDGLRAVREAYSG